MAKQLLGFPANAFHRVKSIRPFSTPLFLYHYGERKLYGAFEATCEAGMNLDRTAWVHAARAKDNLKRLRTGAAPSDGSPFPAQVRFQPRGAREGATLYPPLPESKIRHILTYKQGGGRGGGFEFGLSPNQVARLLEAFRREQNEQQQQQQYGWTEYGGQHRGGGGRR